MSQPPLNALRVFEAFAGTGNFRAAAEALFVTQPAASHQVKHLEQWLGVPLFDHGGRILEMLPRGVALARDLATASLAMIQPDLAEGRLVQLSDVSVLENFTDYLTPSDLTEKRCSPAQGPSGFPVVDRNRAAALAQEEGGCHRGTDGGDEQAEQVQAGDPAADVCTGIAPDSGAD